MASINAPSKHSEEYFAARIETLQKGIKAKIPSLDDASALKAFLDSCTAIKSAIDSKKKAEDLQYTIMKDQKAAPNIVQKAKDLVAECIQTIDDTWTCGINSGKLVMNELDLASMEANLIECTILVQGTPKGLADFCAQGNGPLVDEFLGNREWQKLMIHEGGASNGNWGEAIQLHTKLLSQIKDNSTKMRRKLALAVALELATDIKIFHSTDTFVDPEDRFWTYVKAYENNELDKAFEHFSVWELRHAIDSDAQDDEIQWGRDYLKAYRPDEYLSTDDHWKYVRAVRTDMNYHHPENPFSNYKELLSAGGECGARAWFGRFMAKNFGIPTWGCRQPGHAAMTKWTPTGWCTLLGAGFAFSSWTDNRYTGRKDFTRNGLDFEEETKARMNSCQCEYYHKLTLLECLAESLGEIIEYEVTVEKPWRSLSLVQRRALAQNAPAETRLAKETTDEPVMMQEEECYAGSSGCFIIPASTTTTPPSRALIVMPSFLGGNQIHLTFAKYRDELNYANDGSLDYKIPEMIPAGFYNLSAKLVNVHQTQRPLNLTIESCDEGAFIDVQSIEVPYTCGTWQKTLPVRINLQPGNLLKFSREEPYHGLSIKEFTLEKSGESI